MTENVFFAGALAAVALAFGGFAWLCARSFAEGADNLARTAGEEASRSFEEVFLFIPPKRMAEIGKCAACAAFFAFFIPLFSFTDAVSTTAGTALGALAALAAFSLPGKIAGSVKAKRRIKFDGQLVDALSSMSNALRAGFSINQAFESVAENSEKPISQEFGVVRQQMRVGMSFDDALSSLEKRVGSEDLSLVVSAIEIARRTGGNLTRPHAHRAAREDPDGAGPAPGPYSFGHAVHSGCGDDRLEAGSDDSFPAFPEGRGLRGLRRNARGVRMACNPQNHKDRRLTPWATHSRVCSR